MALIVETGAGLIDAESYCTVAFADGYHADRGNDSWDAVDNKEAALRKAADYIQQTYRSSWLGFRVRQTQAMDWPRYQVQRDKSGVYPLIAYYSADSVPLEIQKAQAELALKSIAGELLADIEPPISSEQVGPLLISYFQGDIRTKKYPAIDRLLSPFLNSSLNIKVARA